MIYTPGLTLEGAEKVVIEGAYKFYRGNKTTTALALGISVRTLDTKLEKYEAELESRRKAELKAIQERQDFLERSRKVAPQFQVQSSIDNRTFAPILMTNDKK